MPGQQKVKKGLPKRTGKEQMKRMCAASHARMVERKTERTTAQQRRETQNIVLTRGMTFSTKTARRKYLDSVRRG